MKTKQVKKPKSNAPAKLALVITKLEKRVPAKATAAAGTCARFYCDF